MRVNLAVQILSKSMAEALRRSMPLDEVSETANFCQLMNDFFDRCNVRSIHEHQRKNNTLLAPYEKCDDSRFVWLTNTFLKYFLDWNFSSTSLTGKKRLILKQKSSTKTNWDECLFHCKHLKGYKYLCIVLLNVQSSCYRMELTTSSLKGSCKTALRKTLVIKDNVGEDQITPMQFSLGTTIGFFRCKEMLVLYPEGIVTVGYH
ncbi:Hypothetical predicted protein [Paramuricea clavata]|uniref:Transposable element P transposase-like GTP-binding insertion domain-containing protein n=1 Tax=Paramuricea clavata TaxID=317549 RepID=A0A6S7HTN2_PARCT|nr:Hypothetical predicted protein [Paramuricea clavata]